ncbi:MAG: ABC transporter ATP-binding protein [Flavobacteriales bacterium]|nr:ABC transporter ATP-binding protein [Flavobacteriales bacterium]
MSRHIAIKAEGISKKFELKHRNDTNGPSHLWALNDVTFEVVQGESVSIIGANGSGKSTLLQVLSGVTGLTSGRAELLGKVASILEIGAGFHPELSGRENVFLNGRLLGFSTKEITDQFDRIIDFSGISGFIDEPVKHYSSGMYLRLAFSIMANLNADVYLLDEVMSVGDSAFQLQSRRKIDELKAGGRTVLMVSHALNSVAEASDRVLYLKNGRLMATDSDAIQTYLSDNSGDLFAFAPDECVKLRDLSAQFGGTGLKLMAARIVTADDLPTGIRPDREFDICLELEATGCDPLDIHCPVMDATGIMLFQCSTVENETPAITSPGHYSITFTVPADLLNSRMYYLNLLVIRDRTETILRADRFAALRVANIAAGRPGSEFLSRTLIRPNVRNSIVKL